MATIKIKFDDGTSVEFEGIITEYEEYFKCMSVSSFEEPFIENVQLPGGSLNVSIEYTKKERKAK